MYRSKTLGITCVLFLISGCGIFTSAGSQPSYAIFKNIPKMQLEAIQKSIRKQQIKDLMLPTKTPYPITDAHCPTPPNATPGIPSIIIYVGNRNQRRAMEIDAWASPNNMPVTKKNVSLMHAKMTRLDNGTVAEYGYNAHASQLAWTENHVEYMISSSTAQNKRDLNERQLIRIANSLQ